MNIVLLGAPGVGKGTNAVELSKRLNIPHISSGDIFRQNIKENTSLGQEAKGFIDQGKLVPDDVTINMVKARLSQTDTNGGYLLDGFPRTITQAEELSKFTKVDVVLNIEADHDVIISRLGGRLMGDDGKVYHKVNNPPPSDVKVHQRDDDKPEKIKERLKVYENQTAPLIDYYQEKGLLKVVTINEDFNHHKEEIMSRVMGAINR